MIYVVDLPRAEAFYRDALGLRPIAGTRSATWVEFEAGPAATLALHAIPTAIAAEIEIASPPVKREETPIKLIFAVQDVAAERVRLEALGVTVELRPWGDLDVVDPEGNICSIASRVSDTRAS